MRESLGKMLARAGAAPAEAEPATVPQKPAPARAAPRPVPQPAAEEEVIEIIDEDPKAALRKAKPAKAAKQVKPAPEPEGESPIVADGDEKIISVDQITDLSGLILPKGATFKVEEINLHGRINAFEGTGAAGCRRSLPRSGRRSSQLPVSRISILMRRSLPKKSRQSPRQKNSGWVPSSRQSVRNWWNTTPRSTARWSTSPLPPNPALKRWKCTRSMNRMPLYGSPTTTQPMNTCTTFSSPYSPIRKKTC